MSSALAMTRMPACGHEEGITVTLRFTLKEMKGWLVPAPAHEGLDGFYLHKRYMPQSIVYVSSCVCHLSSQGGSERFVLYTLSQMDSIPSADVQELKRAIAPAVYDVAQNALKTGFNLTVDFLHKIKTYQFWPLPKTSGEQLWDDLNEQGKGFGAVPATDYEIMMALNSTTFEREMHHDSKYDCSICLEEFAEDTQVYQMPCLHFFHGSCIVKWLRRSNCCPYCRFRLQQES